MQTMHINQRKEQFSRAWVSAVAAVAGCNISNRAVDDDSIDIAFGVGSGRRARVEAQLKCTSVADESEGVVRFALPLKNYDDLRGVDLCVPRILIVLLVPPSEAEWVHHTNEQLVLRRCAWWCSLRTAAASTNSSSVTVSLTERFNASALSDILQRIDQGGAP